MDSVQAWFDDLYLEHASKMIQVASRVLGNVETAEDVVQNVFIVLLARQEEVKQLEKPAAWLYKTLRNQIGNELQRAKYRQTLSIDEQLELGITDTYFSSLSDALPPELTEQERDILCLFYEDRLSHKEIAKRLDKSVFASRARLSRAKARCKKIFLKYSKI